MWVNPQEAADLVTCTEESLNEKQKLINDSDWQKLWLWKFDIKAY